MAKTKEMILVSKRDVPLLTIHDTPFETVSVFKLLSVHISAYLRWKTHTEYIIFEAMPRLKTILYETAEKSRFVIVTFRPIVLLYYSH